jgi:hypothetical protein
MYVYPCINVHAVSLPVPLKEQDVIGKKKTVYFIM